MKIVIDIVQKQFILISGLIFIIGFLPACGDGGGVSSTVTTTTTASAAVSTITNTDLYDIVDTNQSVCYNSSTGASATCAGSGYDADYDGNQPDYTLTDGGLTVTDNVTGLIWLQSTDTDGVSGLDVDDKKSQTLAVTYCSGLTTAGHTWRLPSIKELYSLILFSGKDASNYSGTDTSTLTPFIDNSIFDIGFGDTSAGERIIDGQYASSTLYVSTTMAGDATMFGVNFVDGRIKGYPVSLSGTDKTFYVRCVTGNTNYGTNVFVDNTDTTISDTATGLMWQKNDSASTNWDDAVANCEAATTATYTDWRLPNTKQLQSILDYTRSPAASSYAAIDDTFFNATSFNNEESVTDWGYYWASTTHVDNDSDGSNATYLSFGRALGYFDTDPSAATSYVIYDVHGAGSQRSNDKLDVANEPGAAAGTESNGTFYFHGPQGDILRLDNKVRCVRNITNNNFYFSANEGTNGTELWVTNGTEAGTKMVKDIRSGSLSSLPDNQTLMNDIVYFTANDGVNGEELWKSDGTDAGTVMVKDINAGSTSSAPRYLTILGDTLYFRANDGTNSTELWKSDGTDAGTVMVKDINSGAANSFISDIAVMNSTLYFSATDGTNGKELWKSDGTDAGTVMVKDIIVGITSSSPGSFVAMNNTLYFNANDGTNGYELWKSDGTDAGTVMVKDINVGSTNSGPNFIEAMGSTIYFNATDGINGKELWKSDGTSAGTVMLKDINISADSNPVELVTMSNAFYFAADDGTNGKELWKSDGTEAGTVMLKDIHSSASGVIKLLGQINGVLYFVADDGVNGVELWKSDGTESGTVQVKDIDSTGSGLADYNT